MPCPDLRGLKQEDLEFKVIFPACHIPKQNKGHRDTAPNPRGAAPRSQARQDLSIKPA